jgi:Holliday junction resolvasome RuvABC endonuclease subunit
MFVLGLDPSITGFGWCVYETHGADDREVLAQGVIGTSPKNGPMPWRYRYLREAFRDLLAKYPQVDIVGIEHPPYKASYSLGLYALYMQVWEALLDHRKSFVYFLPSQLKAYVRHHFEESGRMTKQDMKEFFVEKFQHKGRLNNNIADAGVAGYMAERYWKFLEGEIGEEDLSEYEHDLFLKTTTRRKTGKVVKDGITYFEGETSKSKAIHYADPKYDHLYSQDEGGQDPYEVGYDPSK